MITANQKKFVKSLSQKKFRNIHKCFVVEGIKMVEELLTSNFDIHSIYAVKDCLVNLNNYDVITISEKELLSISSFKTPNQILAVVNYKENDIADIDNNFSIVLDNIQDPGNLGTIIRTADWFGIKNIICSNNSVDIYNPKVIQATMGSIFRVKVCYTDLRELISNTSKNVYAAVIEGEDVYKTKLNQNNSYLLMGNESKGISEELLPLIKHKITIPKKGLAESLNVSVATAILCAEFVK